MKSVKSEIYTEDYYLRTCLGSEEFRASNGDKLHPKLEKLLQTIPISRGAKVLDVGCGRGDITLYFAKRRHIAVGIDYAKAAISIAQKLKKKCPPQIQKQLTFKQMDIKHLQFPDNTFDVIICIDVLEHLYKEEVEAAVRELSRVLKPEGILFFHTGPNKILYNVVYPLYILPINRVLTTIDQCIKRKNYAPLPIDPRTPEEKVQHVNEPDYFYLRNLFRRQHFRGEIKIEIGFRKKVTGIRSHLYNWLITLYPLSKIPPLSFLFGSIFIGILRNKK